MDNENLNNEINETEQVNNEEVTVIEEKDQVIEETAVKEEPVQTVKEEPAARAYEEPVRRAYEEPQFYYNIPVYTQEVKESKPKKSGGKFWMAATAVLMAICLVTSSFAIGTVVGKDGKAERRNVKLGGINGDYQEILSGVEVGEVVVVDGTHKVQVGALIDGVELAK